MRRINLFDIFGTLSLIVGTLFFIVFVLILPRSWTGSNYEALMGIPDSAPTLTATAVITPTATERPREAVLSIDNQSGKVLCGLYVKGDYTDTTLQPINILAGNPPIEPDTIRRFPLPAVEYLLRVDDCTGIEVARWQTTLDGEVLWRITDK